MRFADFLVDLLHRLQLNHFMVYSKNLRQCVEISCVQFDRRLGSRAADLHAVLLQSEQTTLNAFLEDLARLQAETSYRLVN